MRALLCCLHFLVVLIPGLAFLMARPIPRRVSLLACSVSLGLAGLLVMLFPANLELVTLSIRGTRVMVLDELSLWLLPFTLTIYLAILLCTPREYRRPGATDEMLLGLSLDLAFFSMHSPIWLALIWPLTHLPLFLAIRRSTPKPARLLRILAVFLIPGCLLFMTGAVMCGLSETGRRPLWALLLLTGGIAVRKAIVPFHQWITELFESGPLGPCIAFTSPQLGAYATVRLLAQNAPDSLLVGLGLAALITSVYGACLAMGQRSVRSAYAGLRMGQASLVFAGLQCTTRAGLAGGLALWISGGLALTGLGLAVRGLEARRGRLSLDVYHGGFDRSPILAACFLILGLSSVGFPGTLGFVSQELLLDGTTRIYPHVGILAAVTTTLNGITILRIYSRLFCGSRVTYSISQSLQLREKLAMLSLVAFVIVFGLMPQPFVASRWRCADLVLTQRQAHGL